MPGYESSAYVCSYWGLTRGMRRKESTIVRGWRCLQSSSGPPPTSRSPPIFSEHAIYVAVNRGAHMQKKKECMQVQKFGQFEIAIVRVVRATLRQGAWVYCSSRCSRLTKVHFKQCFSLPMKPDLRYSGCVHLFSLSLSPYSSFFYWCFFSRPLFPLQ